MFQPIFIFFEVFTSSINITFDWKYKELSEERIAAPTTFTTPATVLL